MSTVTYILGIVISVITLIIVIEMLRRHRLRERHAIWWFTACLIILVVAIFPVILDWLATLMGIAAPANLVFILSIIVLFFVSLQHSSELTTLEAKVRRLAEDVALQELRIAELEKSAQAGSAKTRTSKSAQSTTRRK